jgi:hypothetical protein
LIFSHILFLFIFLLAFLPLPSRGSPESTPRLVLQEEEEEEGEEEEAHR